MASQVEICNFALKLSGGERITALTDNTESGRLANQWYQQTVDELLREYPFAFARKRVALGQLTSTPIMDYDYEYQLPSDLLRILRLNEGLDDYEIEGQKLLTDVSTVNILYVSRVTNSGLFDPLFVKALSLKLAIQFAWALHQEQGLQVKLIEQYNQLAIPLAKYIDSAENARKSLQVRRSNWQNARYAGRPT